MENRESDVIVQACHSKVLFKVDEACIADISAVEVA
jgi:hypothetical protein